MVEAAGVEPASERPVAAKLYMLSRAFEFATAIKVRRKWRPLAPGVSCRRAGRTAAPAR